MVPAGITGAVIDELAAVLEPGDMIIDGGNSNYRDDIARADRARDASSSTSSTAARAVASGVSSAASA